MTVNLT